MKKSHSSRGNNSGHDRHNVKPALLVSYVYLKGFLPYRDQYVYRDWVMDSGAFSAYKSGTVIDLQQYIDTCHELLETDPTLTEVYALDVIGDWRASQRNTERMWDQGIPAIPCFHYGEPWELLKEYGSSYDKIAIGGAKDRKDRKGFIGQCMARVWPKKVHAFGLSGRSMVLGFPFHSVDSTNWEVDPCMYGRWRNFSYHNRVPMRGSKQPLHLEIAWYMELEKAAQDRWANEMDIIDPTKESPRPTIRLVVGSARTSGVSGLRIFDRLYELEECL